MKRFKLPIALCLIVLAESLCFGQATIVTQNLSQNAISGGGGSGTVTSVGLSLPASLFTVSGSPVTTSGTLSGAFANVNAHTFVGNNTGSSATAALVQPACGDLSNAAASCSTDTTNASNVVSGTLGTGRGGLGTSASSVPAHNYFGNNTGSATGGAFVRPVCADLSNASASCSTDATNASNIASGTLPAGRLPVPGVASLGGVFSKAAVSHNFLTSISSVDGSIGQAQPACADLSDATASCSTDATNASNITSGTLPNARLVSVPNSALANSSITVNTTSPLGGGSTPSLGGSLTITCTTCVTSAASLTLNAVVLGAGSQASKTATFIATDGTKELDIGPADTTNNGVLGLKGKTSGTATITAPSAAGTSTNAFVFSNVINVPAGGVGNDAISIGNINTGFYGSTGVGISVSIAGSDSTGFASGEVRMLSTGRFTWCPSSGMNCTIDAGISRDGIGILDVGNGASGNTTGKLKASAFISKGTTFTTNAGCSETSLVGGGSAGKFTSGTTGTCTVVITFGDSATSTTGWTCNAHNTTTTANPINQTASSTTSCTISGTTVSGDVITFDATGW